MSPTTQKDLAINRYHRVPPESLEIPRDLNSKILGIRVVTAPPYTLVVAAWSSCCMVVPPARPPEQSCCDKMRTCLLQLPNSGSGLLLCTNTTTCSQVALGAGGSVRSLPPDPLGKARYCRAKKGQHGSLAAAASFQDLQSMQHGTTESDRAEYWNHVCSGNYVSCLLVPPRQSPLHRVNQTFQLERHQGSHLLCFQGSVAPCQLETFHRESAGLTSSKGFGPAHVLSEESLLSWQPPASKYIKPLPKLNWIHQKNIKISRNLLKKKYEHQTKSQNGGIKTVFSYYTFSLKPIHWLREWKLSKAKSAKRLGGFGSHLAFNNAATVAVSEPAEDAATVSGVRP